MDRRSDYESNDCRHGRIKFSYFISYHRSLDDRIKKESLFPSLPDNASISIYLTFNRLVLILMLENSVDIFKYAARSIFNCLQKKGGGGKKYEIKKYR